MQCNKNSPYFPCGFRIRAKIRENTYHFIIKGSTSFEKWGKFRKSLHKFRFVFLFVLKMGNSDWNCPLIALIMRFFLAYIILIELCTSRDVVINHQKMELFFSLFLMDCTEEHSTGFNSHHGSRWQVSDRN